MYTDPKETRSDDNWIDETYRIRAESKAYERNRTIDAFDRIQDRVNEYLKDSSNYDCENPTQDDEEQ